MAIVLRDIILGYIDEALDIDDLENMGDYVNSVIAAESLQEWQLSDILRQLHADLAEAFQIEKNHARRSRLKSALVHFEADFSDYLVAKETGTLPLHNR